MFLACVITPAFRRIPESSINWTGCRIGSGMTIISLVAGVMKEAGEQEDNTFCESKHSNQKKGGRV